MNIEEGMNIEYDVDCTPRYTYKLWDKYGDEADKCRSYTIITAANCFMKRGSRGVKITGTKSPGKEFDYIAMGGYK